MKNILKLITFKNIALVFSAAACLFIFAAAFLYSLIEISYFFDKPTNFFIAFAALYVSYRIFWRLFNNPFAIKVRAYNKVFHGRMGWMLLTICTLLSAGYTFRPFSDDPDDIDEVHALEVSYLLGDERTMPLEIFMNRQMEEESESVVKKLKILHPKLVINSWKKIENIEYCNEHYLSDFNLKVCVPNQRRFGLFYPNWRFWHIMEVRWTSGDCGGGGLYLKGINKWWRIKTLNGMCWTRVKLIEQPK